MQNLMLSKKPGRRLSTGNKSVILYGGKSKGLRKGFFGSTMIKKVKAIVLRAAGINCDLETQFALELADAKAERIHINRLIENKAMLSEYQILVFPGGFSYGDDVAAGKIMANQVVNHLIEAVRKFIDDGKLVLGFCNGFQVLVKAGLLPGSDSDVQPAAPGAAAATQNDEKDLTITYNDSGKYEDRWVYLQSQKTKSVFIEPDRQIYLPVAHGEGKIVVRNAEMLEKLKQNNLIAFKYVDERGQEGPFPINPNGSIESIAGLVDATGRVMGMMPHPERFVRLTQHPRWTRLKDKTEADGMIIFNNAVKYVKEHF
jgi:phosphoribosylformylglycinamidine synthase